jgi:hypothetical protein
MRRVSTLLVACAVTLAGPASAQVAHATCRNGNTDRAESGLQGEVTAAEGAARAIVNCNTDLVGQYQGEGASWQLTAWKTCAYYDQRKGTNLAHPGTVALDVSDPSHPKPTAYLSDPAMLDPWESLKVNAKRQLLAADQGTCCGAAAGAGPGFSIYDISGDCTHPVQKAFINAPAALGHTGQWAPDGNTYYITTVAQTTASMVAVDTSDPSNPKQLATYTSTFNPSFHDLEFSRDGNTAYIAAAGGLGGTSPNGLIILDVSDIQSRKASPQVRQIGTLTWDDGSIIAQNALPITIAGKPYILFTDEAGVASFTGSCVAGKSGHGFPRLIDISDPANPKTVSKLMLDVMEPANCQQSLALKMTTTTQLFGYSCHYCNVDDPDDAKIAACNCFASGMRLFDIHDPLNPKELGYFRAPAQGTKALPGSQYANSAGSATFSRPIDWASSKPSFPKDRGASSGDIWTTSQDNGFLVVHYDKGGGGCSTGGQSLAGIVVLALTALWRSGLRRRATQ